MAPVTLRALPGAVEQHPRTGEAEQPLDVWYSAGYVQDEWRPRSNLTVTGGLRFDVSQFKNTAYDNPNADTLTFRDEKGQPVSTARARCPTRRCCGRRVWP